MLAILFNSARISFVEKERKHRVEMTQAEIQFAESFVHAIGSVTADSEHLLNEMKADHITMTDVQNTLKYGDIIEVNSYGRCVVRLMKGMRKGTVVVIDVREKKLVTAWYNSPKDKHETLRMSEYGWKVNVQEYLTLLN